MYRPITYTSMLSILYVVEWLHNIIHTPATHGDMQMMQEISIDI